MPWTKTGSFAIPFNHGGGTILRRQCSYITHQPQSIKEIGILGYADGDIKIVAKFLDETQATAFLQKATQPNPTQPNPTQPNPQPLPADYFDSLVFRKSIQITSQNPAHFSAYLKLLVEEDAHVKEILIDMCQSLNISTILGLTLEDLKTKTAEEALALAIETQQNKSYDLINELLAYYWEQSLLPVRQRFTFNDMYDLACAISSDNPHYSRAQDFCVDILMRQEFNANPKEQKEEASSLGEVLSLEEDENLLQDDYFPNLELKFMHALKGTRQDLTDMLYNELCGYGLGLPAKVKNIKGEAATLLSLAEVIRTAQPVLKKHAVQTGAHRFFPAQEISPHNNTSTVNMHIDLGAGMGMD